jgi:hypothetical protein
VREDERDEYDVMSDPRHRGDCPDTVARPARWSETFRVLARPECYRLVGSDLCLVTTTVLRCPLAVSVARRFLTSLSAWRWVENEAKRSSPMRTDQPTLVGSTRKIVMIACMATNERSTNWRRITAASAGQIFSEACRQLRHARELTLRPGPTADPLQDR